MDNKQENSSAADMERRLEETTCVHFNGAQKTCRAGVEYAAVTRRTFLGKESLPCIGCRNSAGAKCDKYTAPNATELAEKRERTDLLLRARRMIQQKEGGLMGVSGQIVCPRCGGSLGYSISPFNGHIRGGCVTTKGCLTFIE